MNERDFVGSSIARLLRKIETAAAVAQGKGYGTATVRREVAWANAALERRMSLAIDVGGNVGEYTDALCRVQPELEVHVFEPSATNVPVLRRRFDGRDRIRINPLALGSERSTGTLHAEKPGSGLGSLTRRRLDHFDIEFSHAERVDVVRFDEYWDTVLGRRTIDLMKLDVEGHELDVLSGCGQALDATRAVQFEFGGANVDTRTYFRDFWYFFTERGFALARMTPLGLSRVERYHELDERFSTTNFLALRRGS